jgi:hypothetical protein
VYTTAIKKVPVSLHYICKKIVKDYSARPEGAFLSGINFNTAKLDAETE